MRYIDKTKFAIAVLLALVILIGAGNLWATESSVTSTKHQFQQEQEQQNRLAEQQKLAQQAAGRLVEQKLCTSFATLSALQPPAGTAADPSRIYEQKLHAILVGLGFDIKCPAKQ